MSVNHPIVNFKNTREFTPIAQIFFGDGTHNVKKWCKYFTFRVLLFRRAVMVIALSLWHEATFAQFAMRAWSLGILLFSGSLYALAFGAGKFLVWITPVGGTLFLIGWLCLAYGSFKSKSV